jgi:Uma2 family endonuclease
MALQTQPEVVRRRFSVEDYHRMVEAGILGEKDRVELIEGEIVEMSPSGWRHARCVARLNSLLSRGLGPGLLLGVQVPVKLGEFGQPEPDFVLVPEEGYDGSHPGPEHALLLAEVSDTSQAYDRERKLPLYARHGYREAWIVDLQAEVVERYTGPSESGYRFVRRFGRGEVVESESLPGIVVAVDGLFR